MFQWRSEMHTFGLVDRDSALWWTVHRKGNDIQPVEALWMAFRNRYSIIDELTNWRSTFDGR